MFTTPSCVPAHTNSPRFTTQQDSSSSLHVVVWYTISRSFTEMNDSEPSALATTTLSREGQ